MAEGLFRSPLLRLPLELRDQIYGYVLPNVDEVCIKPGFKENVQHEGDIEWFDNLFELRRDGDYCYPAILAVNKQVNAEASRIIWNRTYTITASTKCIEFLGAEYPIAPYNHIPGPYNRLPNQRDEFPVAFPFHKARAVRVRVVNSGYPGGVLWGPFGFHLKKLSRVLERIREKGLPLKRLMIDFSAWGDGPHFTDMADIITLFKAFEPCESLARLCDLTCGDWATTSPQAVLMARTLGRAIIYRCPLDEKGIDNTGALTLRTGPAASEPDHENGDLILLVQERLCGCGEGHELICTEWHTRIRRI